MKKTAIYPGTFDPITFGHIDLIQKSLKIVDKIIVAISDSNQKDYLFTSEERIQIVRSVKYVDLAIPQNSIDKFEAWKKLKFDILFVGDDWFENKKWKNFEKKLKSKKVKIIYFPYTKGTSSTLINKTIQKLRK